MYNPRRWFPFRFMRPEHLVAVLLGLAVVVYGVVATLGGGRRTAGVGTALAATSDGPVRLAHFSYVTGNVSWRPSDDSSWSDATMNLPIRQGSTLAVSGGGRAEVQFDDGSRMRLGDGAVVTMRSLYSDADGEFSELILRDGSVDFDLRHNKSVYQIDAPIVSVDATGPARLRIDAEQGVRVTVREGNCTLVGDQGRQTIGAGEYVALRNANDPYRVATLETTDNFDQWTAVRDRNEERALHSRYRRYLPRGAAIAADNLDDYGTWRDDPNYGEVWCPTVSSADWRPYSRGHWVWVAPFGWTWVGSEPWGWAPYHYGTWVDESYGWAWVPGPATQYWSPAVVRWYDDDEDIAWTACGPREVVYPPSLSIGFSGGDWSLFFSIGGAADYYPTYGSYCEPRPWSNQIVNNYTVVNNYYGDSTTIQNVSYSRTTVIPQNWNGATVATRDSFAGRERFAPLAGDPRTFFGRSRAIAGGTPVRPVANSFTASRTTLSSDPVPKAVLDRSVRAPSDPRQGLQAARSFARPGANRGMVAAAVPHSRERTAAVQARNALGLGPRGGAPAGMANRGRPVPSAANTSVGRTTAQAPLVRPGSGIPTGARTAAAAANRARAQVRNNQVQNRQARGLAGAAKGAGAQVRGNKPVQRGPMQRRQAGGAAPANRRPAGRNNPPVRGPRNGGGGQGLQRRPAGRTAPPSHPIRGPRNGGGQGPQRKPAGRTAPPSHPIRGPRNGGGQGPQRKPAGRTAPPSHPIRGPRNGGGQGQQRRSGGRTGPQSPPRSRGGGPARGRSQVTTHTRMPARRSMGGPQGPGRMSRGGSSGPARVHSNPPPSRGGGPRGGGGRQAPPAGRGGGGPAQGRNQGHSQGQGQGRSKNGGR